MGEPGVQGHSQLHKEFQASLRYGRACPQTTKQNKNKFKKKLKINCFFFKFTLLILMLYIKQVLSKWSLEA